MTDSKAVRIWDGHSNDVADAIDGHIQRYPIPVDRKVSGCKHLVLYLGNRYTVIAGHISPEKLRAFLENDDDA